VIETFAHWQGDTGSAHDHIREYWRREVFPRSRTTDFESFWESAVRRGVVQVAPVSRALPGNPTFTTSPTPPARAADTDRIELQLHQSVALPDVSSSGNAWLLELPDPISKVSWDNIAAISPAMARKLNIENGDILIIRTDRSDGAAVELPASVQEGQTDNCISVALGYGSIATERFHSVGPRWISERPSVGPHGRVGVRSSGMHWFDGASFRREMPVTVRKSGRRVELALSQNYSYLRVPTPEGDGTGEQRPCVRETTVVALAAGTNNHDMLHAEHGSMWPEHPYDGHHWGMTIDLSACTGCSACVIACQAENNIPVVGKDEVRRTRALHWLRIDRYYFDGDDAVLRVAHQPMLCHHCDNAPCETVCPVLATVHSEEGLNQQVYNRCVGTRYCANNCPYKIRRFNWFDYPRGKDGENLVLNPDVTIRSRGVMEKCSFCVQRIQEARIRAKTEDRTIIDGDIQTACMQSCPTRAIRFGDMNEEGSRLASAMRSPRHYRVLEELGIKPSVGYLSQVRNPDSEEIPHG